MAGRESPRSATLLNRFLCSLSSIDCMGKVWIEVCLVSARGLRQSSSLWKLQWYAVAWIDPCNKYCTKLDASANGNPVWRMKFASSVDESNSSFDDLALNVQVYIREPVFLTETLRGTATISLKEFVAKHNKSSENSSAGTGEVGSYQLRKRNSSKPQGFIDLSVHISAERAEPYSYPLADRSDTVTLSTDDGSIPIQADRPPSLQEAPFPANFFKPSASGPSYRPPATHSSTLSLSPPNVVNLPTIFPRGENLQNSASINLPPSRPGVSPKTGSGFGMGLGAGALAAGAFIFGDDFMAGFDAPVGNMGNASLSRTTDPSI